MFMEHPHPPNKTALQAKTNTSWIPEKDQQTGLGRKLSWLFPGVVSSRLHSDWIGIKVHKPELLGLKMVSYQYFLDNYCNVTL